MEYVKIRSWHKILTPTRMFNTFRTRCGRTVVALPDLVRPYEEINNEKTCESCLRFAALDNSRKDE